MGRRWGLGASAPRMVAVAVTMVRRTQRGRGEKLRHEIRECSSATASAAAAAQVPQWLPSGQGDAAAAGASATGAPMLPMAMQLLAPPEGVGGTSGFAMASAQMLLQQAAAAAQVIQALAATVREMEVR